MSKKVCVLEDNDDIRELIGFILEEEKFDVVSFSTVSEFNSKAINVDADVFLLDVMLPDGNGLEVCRNLKSQEKTKNIPVMIMTANSKMDEMSNECDAEDFISKPFDINDLVKRINLQVNKQ